jgi:SAM-dependent methyltransferase
MEQSTKMKLSAISGLLSSVCWMIGDILLVGFTPDMANYPGIAQSTVMPMPDLAALMLTGSTLRLMLGALIAAFSIPLMILALYIVYQLLKPAGKKYSVLCITVLFVAFTWSPLAHASFFYVGESAKTAMSFTGENADAVFSLTGTFIRMLQITWGTAVPLTGIGWLLVSIAILRGKTEFPRGFAFLTPLPMSVVFSGIVQILPSALHTALNGAAFNLAGTAFYTACTILVFRRFSQEPSEENKHTICPWQAGSLLATKLRKVLHPPKRMLSPYVHKGMTAMDIGCGMGYFTLPLADLTGATGHVIAVDMQPEMLAGLTKRAKDSGRSSIQTCLCQDNALLVEAWNGNVDFIVLFMMFHEVPDKTRFAKEIYTALAPGGKVLFAEPIVHVSGKEFQRNYQFLKDAGLQVIQTPHIALCRAEVLQKQDS